MGKGRMEQGLRLHVLASGSKGNAAIVEDAATGAGVLVDCGICKREFFARCDAVGFDAARLSAVLITHEHSDHTKGLGVVLRGLAKQGVVPSVYVHAAVRAACNDVRILEDRCDLRAFSTGDALSFGAMGVHAFRTSHDAAASFGFRFEGTSDAIGFMTDTGIVTGEADEALRDVRVLALESNHDSRMLAQGPYPYPVKRRIASDRGHLSNDQAADELEKLLCTRLEHIVAMHISENNNTYRFPVDALRRVVERAGHAATIRAACQAVPLSI